MSIKFLFVVMQNLEKWYVKASAITPTLSGGSLIVNNNETVNIMTFRVHICGQGALIHGRGKKPSYE